MQPVWQIPLLLLATCAVAAALPRRWRETWLLLASYFFCVWFFSPMALVLLVVSTLSGYAATKWLADAGRPGRSAVLWVNISLNLSLLLAAAWGTMRFTEYVGISFYTLQAVGASLEAYRGRTAQRFGICDFALFQAFLPRLVAGPVESFSAFQHRLRLSQLRPTRASVKRAAPYIAWALLLKLFFAESLGRLRLDLSIASPDLAAWACYLYCFALEFYADLAGYAYLAVGAALLFDMELSWNVRYPYFARSLSEFWRRWHISVTSWFRTNVYYELGGGRAGAARVALNIAVTWLAVALWCGGKWNYALWAVFSAGAVIANHLLRHVGSASESFLGHRTHAILSQLLTFHCVILGWSLYDSHSAGVLLSWLMGSSASVGIPLGSAVMKLAVCYAAVFLIEYMAFSRDSDSPFGELPRFLRISVLLVIAAAILYSLLYAGPILPFHYSLLRS